VKICRSDEVEDPSVYSDTELCGFDEHKPVILHLLSQLKLGMDLTKVKLLLLAVIDVSDMSHHYDAVAILATATVIRPMELL